MPQYDCMYLVSKEDYERVKDGYRANSAHNGMPQENNDCVNGDINGGQVNHIEIGDGGKVVVKPDSLSASGRTRTSLRASQSPHPPQHPVSSHGVNTSRGEREDVPPMEAYDIPAEIGSTSTDKKNVATMTDPVSLRNSWAQTASTPRTISHLHLVGNPSRKRKLPLDSPPKALSSDIGDIISEITYDINADAAKRRKVSPAQDYKGKRQGPIALAASQIMGKSSASERERQKRNVEKQKKSTMHQEEAMNQVIKDRIAELGLSIPKTTMNTRKRKRNEDQEGNDRKKQKKDSTQETPVLS